MTEKFAQALTAGSVPVVIGARNIEEFAVAPPSMIVMRSKQASPVLACNTSRLLALQMPVRYVARRDLSLQLPKGYLTQS